MIVVNGKKILRFPLSLNGQKLTVCLITKGSPKVTMGYGHLKAQGLPSVLKEMFKNFFHIQKNYK